MFFFIHTRPPIYTPTVLLCPYTTLFRAGDPRDAHRGCADQGTDSRTLSQRNPARPPQLRGAGGEPRLFRQGCRPAPASRNGLPRDPAQRSEEHTSELQSLMRNSYAVFCLNTKRQHHKTQTASEHHKQQTLPYNYTYTH